MSKRALERERLAGLSVYELQSRILALESERHEREREMRRAYLNLKEVQERCSALLLSNRVLKESLRRTQKMTEERITDPNTGGQKGRKDERWDLFPFDALDELARVYAFGAKKYADDNWLKGYSWRLSLGALLRHVSRFACGEDRDPETGCLHLAHAAWHCLTLVTFRLRGLGTDDRCVVKGRAA